MSKRDKLRLRILRGASDANIEFNELCSLLQEYGFEERIKRDGSKAKLYPVRQIRELILNYHLQVFIAEVSELAGCIAHGDTKDRRLVIV